MSDSIDKFEELEVKLMKAVEVLKRTQAEKRALEQDVAKLRAGARDNTERVTEFERELVTLRREREEVRLRVEKLLKQIDMLTKVDSAG